MPNASDASGGDAGAGLEPGVVRAIFKEVPERMPMDMDMSESRRRGLQPAGMVRWVIILALCGLVCGVIGNIRSRSMPRVYQASATIFVQGNRPNVMLPTGLSPSLLSSGSDPTNYALAVLGSTDFAREVVRALSLTDDRDFTRGAGVSEIAAGDRLLGMVQVVDNKKGLLVITAEASTGRLAAKVANGYATEFRNRVVRNNQSKRVFLEGKIGTLKSDVESLEGRLKDLSKRRAVVNLDAQTSAAVQKQKALEQSLLDVDANLKAVESELQSTGDLVTLSQLKGQKEALLARKARLATALTGAQGELEALPSAALEQGRLQREIDLKSKLFETLSQQHQLAAIDEQSSQGAYQIIDLAEPPSRPSRPNRMAVTAIAVMIGLMIGVGVNVAISDMRSGFGD